MTVTIQHDAFKLVVDSIIKKLDRLSLFQADVIQTHHEDEVWTIPHLRERAHWRRSMYERPEMISISAPAPADRDYVSRGAWNHPKRISKARELLKLLSSRPRLINTTTNLKDILRKCPIIGGYIGEFAPNLISDCLGADLGEKWGSLVKLCQNFEPENVYNLMFRVRLMAFREVVDM